MTFSVSFLLVHRKLLIFYVGFLSCYFANSVHQIKEFLVESLGSFKYRIISSSNRDDFFLPYLNTCYFFLLPYCYGKDSNTISNESGESGTPYFIPDFKGNCFNFSIVSRMLAIGFSYVVLILLQYIPSILIFFRIFMKRCWTLSKAFCIIMWFFTLILFLCCIRFIDLNMLNHHCVTELKTTRSQCLIFIICYWIQFANILLRIFESMTIREIGNYSTVFKIFSMSLSGFDIRVILAS
jgi:hypothetical protein